MRRVLLAAAIAAGATALAAPCSAQNATVVPAPPAPSSPPAPPSPSHVAAAERLLEASNAEQTFTQGMEQMIRSQLDATPQLRPMEGAIREFVTRYMSYAALKPDLVVLYTSTFSEQDLNDAAAFYHTALGKKMLAKMPEIIAKSSALAQQRLQAHMPEFVELIQARMQEMQPRDSTTKPPR